MRHPIRKAAFVAVAAFILLVVIVRTFHRAGPISPARLQFGGYVTNNSQVKVAILVLTNPGPAQVDYSAIQERRGSNIFVGHGTLASGAIIEYRLPLSDLPTRLLINCAPRHQLREVAEQAAGSLGIKVPPRSSDYTLFSEELVR